MRLSIYLRRFGTLIKLYRLHRSPAGLYVWSLQSPDYISWHEDGRYWIRFRGRKTVKKLRQPLRDFKGAETLSLSVNTFLAARPFDKAEGQVQLRPEEIVLALDGCFAVEVMLSESPLSLSSRPERLNAVVHARDTVHPIITVEAFPLSNNVFPSERFPPAIQRIEGENFFVDHSGRI
jgi:hypothetical protein